MTTIILDERRVRKRALDYDGDYGFVGRLRLWLLKRKANAMLRRTLKPRHRYYSAASIPPYLRQDIGLPPDCGWFDH